MPMQQVNEFSQMQHLFLQMQQLAYSNPAMMQMFAGGMMPNMQAMNGMPMTMGGAAGPSTMAGPSSNGMHMMNGMPSMGMPNGMFGMPNGMGMMGMNGMGMPGTMGMPFSGPAAMPPTPGMSDIAPGTPDLSKDVEASISTKSGKAPIPNSQTIKRKKKVTTSQISSKASTPAKSIPPAKIPRAHSPTRLAGSVFAPGGKTRKFFVQIALNKRSEVTHLIKVWSCSSSSLSSLTLRVLQKGGGAVVTSPDEAHFAVLSHLHTADRQSYSARAAIKGIPAVASRFIHACVDEGELLDAQDYLIDASPSSPVKKEKPLKLKLEGPKKPKSAPKAAPAASTSKRYDEEAGSDDGDEPHRVQARGVKRANSPIVKQEWPRELRSPTPPAFDGRPCDARGAYRYTDEEKEYAQKWVAVLFKRRPDWTNMQLAQRLHEKVGISLIMSVVSHLISSRLIQIPAHTANSWQSYVLRLGNFEEMRKRAAIEFRKQKDHVPAPPTSHGPPPPEKKRKVFQDDSVSLVEQDMQTVVTFFVNGGDALDGDDSEIWNALTKQVSARLLPCTLFLIVWADAV